MKAIIMAGGYGSRLKPLTNDMPKPMVPIINKPIISYIVGLLKQHGICDIAMTLGYKPEHIINYFKDGSDYGVKITYFVEDTPLGTAGSIKGAKSFIDDDFIVISGDAFTNIDLTELIDFHKEHKKSVTMAVKYVDEVSNFGVVKIDKNSNIVSFIEKPQNSSEHLVNTGIYVINKGVLNFIPDGKYDFSKDLFPKILKDMCCYKTDRYWSDIGTLYSYYLTNCDVVKSPEVFNISIN